MKQLPEKWAIKAKKLHNDFIIWFNNQPNVNKGAYYPYTNKQDYFLHYPAYHDGDCFAKYSGIHEGYEEITIEQWREAVKLEVKKQCSPECFCDGSCKGDKVDIDSFVKQCLDPVTYGWKELKSDELITGGELEGYEAPFDMFSNIDGFAVKKGTIYQKAGDTNGYLPKGIGFDWVALPAEWVETWKPVYKAKEKKRVPKSGWVIQVVGGLGIPILDGSTSRPALFNTQADCIEWVKNNGMLDEFYTFLEVDYITEE